MRILLATGIYPPDIGGPATYTRSMARALKERGHEVEVVCYGDRDSGLGIRDSERDFFVYPVRRSLVLPLRYFAFAWKVFRRARKMKADVVYLQGPGSEGFPGTIGAMLAGVPTVMKVVGDYAWEIYQGSRGTELLDEFITHRHAGKVGMLEKIERWTASKASKIITPSEYLKFIVEKWGVDEKKIDVIYNEVKTHGYSQGAVDELKNAYHLERKRVLLYIGRAVPWKHADFIIRLLPQLPDDIVFLIGGDGPSLHAWKQEAEVSGVKDRVVFLGGLNRDQVFNVYRVANLFVLPSGYEGFPNVIPEAIACGLPCFVSDKGGNPETRELFGSDRVTVIPYLDAFAWAKSISAIVPSKDHGVVRGELPPSTMIDQTIEKLKSSVSRL